MIGQEVETCSEKDLSHMPRGRVKGCCCERVALLNSRHEKGLHHSEVSIQLWWSAICLPQDFTWEDQPHHPKVANRTEGFSGRQLAKLVLAYQAGKHRETPLRKIDDHTTIKQVTLKQGSAQQGVNLHDKIRQIGCCRLLSLALVLPGKYLLDVKMKIRCNWLDVFYEFCRAHLQIWKTLAGSLQAWLRQSFSTSWPIGRRWSHGYKHMMIHDDSSRLSTGNDTCYTAA